MLCVLFFIVFSHMFSTTIQEPIICVSDPVKNLAHLSGGFMNWTSPDNCNISTYVVQIIREDNVTFHFETEHTNFNASSVLSLCTKYEVRVIPVSSNDVQGTPSSIDVKLRPEMPENLAISGFSVKTSGRSNITLEWSLEPSHVEKCVDLFRVLVWDEDCNIPYDLYVDDNHFSFNDAVPCMHYQFGVRPIIDPLEEYPVGLFNYIYPGHPTTPPVLASLVQGVTAINVTWILESFQENRCEITAINIDASPLFNISHPVQDDGRRLPVAFELFNLQPNTIYISNFSVVNSAGISEAVMVPLQTLPNDTARGQKVFRSNLPRGLAGNFVGFFQELWQTIRQYIIFK
ncbi:hypothetical protein NQ317_012791 [Molorchus minor]|uniref:Fibronectin type-III domain-containing protein n=1 Tax=Molorchus minor TaxID=1323400 RepID=A0ABQ9K475_9CUCU|nr:hypothetical protein NQ317_012791 [Molorchus minor]